MKDVFTIIEKEEWSKGVWIKVGTAFENRDGSLNIFLDALPCNGRLHVRERKVKPSTPSSEDVDKDTLPEAGEKCPDARRAKS
jgi:hypothetical protein